MADAGEAYSLPPRAPSSRASSNEIDMAGDVFDDEMDLDDIPGVSSGNSRTSVSTFQFQENLLIVSHRIQTPICESNTLIIGAYPTPESLPRKRDTESIWISSSTLQKHFSSGMDNSTLVDEDDSMDLELENGLTLGSDAIMPLEMSLPISQLTAGKWTDVCRFANC